jgi:hypothetical protein
LFIRQLSGVAAHPANAAVSSTAAADLPDIPHFMRRSIASSD